MFYHGAHMAAPESSLTVAQFNQIEPFPSDLGPFNPRQMQAFRDIFSLVREHGVQTAFVGPAVPAPLYRVPVVREKQDQLAALFVGEGFTYVDGTRGFPNDDPANYHDGRHFSARGRRLFSEFFVAKLEEKGLLPCYSN
jgi:hypothetical protein